MTNTDTVKASGSNIRTILSATALAVTTTLVPPALRAEERQQQVAPLGPFDDAEDTDSFFVLNDSPLAMRADDHCYRSVSYGGRTPILERYSRAPNANFHIFPTQWAVPGLGFERRVAKATETVSTVGKASAFYATLADGLKSDMLWDVLVLSQSAGAPLPVVEAIDDMVTVDFSAAGVLVSVLIEEEACFVSALGKQKDIQAKFALKPEAPKDELRQLLWSQFQSFGRSYSEA